jgi:hypothetical protein
MVFANNIKLVAATAGHVFPQSLNAAATTAPGSGGWVAGTALLGRALVAFVQTGAFTSTPSMAFKLQVANDANGGSAADVTGGAIATIAAANTASQGELPMTLIDSTKFYAIVCTATGGTSGFVAGQLRILDPYQTA